MVERQRLTATARHLRSAVAAGALTDLEALAQLWELGAAGVRAGGWWERWRLIVDLTAVLTELDLSRPWPHRHTDWVDFGQRGFRRRYWSGDAHSGNQVRHLIAYVPLGFLLSGWLAAPLPWLLEIGSALVRRQPVDWPDIRLGVTGVWLGHGLLTGAVPVARAGEWVRQVVGADGAADAADA